MASKRRIGLGCARKEENERKGREKETENYKRVKNTRVRAG